MLKFILISLLLCNNLPKKSNVKISGPQTLQSCLCLHVPQLETKQAAQLSQLGIVIFFTNLMKWETSSFHRSRCVWLQCGRSTARVNHQGPFSHTQHPSLAFEESPGRLLNISSRLWLIWEIIWKERAWGEVRERVLLLQSQHQINPPTPHPPVCGVLPEKHLWNKFLSA